MPKSKYEGPNVEDQGIASAKETAPKANEGKQEGSAEIKKNKDRWKGLRDFALYATLLTTPTGFVTAYEKAEPTIDALRVEAGSKIEFSLHSKADKNVKTEVSIKQQEDGSYLLEGETAGGPAEGDVEEGIVNDGGSGFKFVLPVSTDIASLIERLKTSRNPGEAISDILNTSRSGEYMKFRSDREGKSLLAYELKFMPGSGKEGAHATQTEIDEHGKKHVTHIAFTEAEQKAED